MRALLVAAVVLSVSFAGCLGVWEKRPDYEQTDEQVTGQWLAHLDGVSNLTAPNTHLVGHHNGVDDSGLLERIPEDGYYTEIAVHDNLVYLARASASGSFGGFSIIDVQDLARPTFVGSYEAPTGSDLELNHDGTLAFFGTQRNAVEEVAGRGQKTQDPRPALPRGIHVVDVSDPTSPTFLSYLPLPYNGVHTITYHLHENGNEYLFVATYDFGSNTLPSSSTPPVPLAGGGLPDPNPATQRVIVYQIMEGGQSLVPVGQYQVIEEAGSGKSHFPHDTYVQVHPLTKDTLLYVSYWDLGLRVVNINDPTNPVELDHHSEFSPSSRGNIHFSRPLDIMPGDRHITVTEPEIINADETGYLHFIDTTDPEDISKAGPDAYWTLPGELTVTDLDYSPHNFDVRGGVIALAHNMAGVWFIDASDLENAMDPKSTGYYLPDMEREPSPRPVPWTWGVRWINDSTVLVSDEGSGLHIVSYDAPTYP